ncbi:M23 family metallopeptidase [Gleimia coleocanis]|uniref:M23 family metallopeptidase n=1 Tax=Gleimia coleocanis TaxID=103618 RepID=UPI0009FC345F
MTLPRFTVWLLAFYLTWLPASTAKSPKQNIWSPPLSGTLVVGERFTPPEYTWLSGHRGVDLCPLPGAAVYAPTAGTVIYAGVLNDRKVVSIRTPSGLKTSFEPLQVTVSKNQLVQPGDLLGYLEPGHVSNGKVTNCLHWGVRTDNGKYLNPLQFLVGRPRLLPWTEPPSGNLHSKNSKSAYSTGSSIGSAG